MIQDLNQYSDILKLFGKLFKHVEQKRDLENLLMLKKSFF